MTMSQPTPNSLTVVLVHGAFADSSSWAGVIERLHTKGTKAIAAANPLRGLKSDSAYLAAVIDEIPGPVLAVGHSYGGAVISNAERAGADITEVDGSHLVMLSQPDVVTEVIESALAKLS